MAISHLLYEPRMSSFTIRFAPLFAPCLQLRLQAIQRCHSSMTQHVCFHEGTFVINQSDIAGSNLLFADFVMAAVRGLMFCRGLTPVVCSPVNEEENSDFDSSSSTLSEVEIENSLPQSQVPLKRTATVMVQREEQRGKFPPKQLKFAFWLNYGLIKQLLLPISHFLLFFLFFVHIDQKLRMRTVHLNLKCRRKNCKRGGLKRRSDRQVPA